MNKIIISASNTHTELLRIGGPLLQDLVRTADTDDKAMSILYVTFLLNEAIQELADTKLGEVVMERAIMRMVDFGLANFAVRHHTTYEPGQTNLH